MDPRPRTLKVTSVFTPHPRLHQTLQPSSEHISSPLHLLCSIQCPTPRDNSKYLSQPLSTMATKGKFEPKTPVVLNPPKDDPITPEFLAKCNGMSLPVTQWPYPRLQLTPNPGIDSNLCYVAIKVPLLSTAPPTPSLPPLPRG